MKQKKKKSPQNSLLYFKGIKYLFFVFIFFLPTQLGKHFFLPFSYLSGVRIDYLAPTLYLTDIIAILLTFFNLKVLFQFFKKKIFIIFLILLLINISFSLIPQLTLYSSIKFLEFLVIFSLFSKTELPNKWIIISLITIGSVELFLSITQFVDKHSIQGIFYFLGERYVNLSLPDIAKASLFGIEILRPYGTFSHPNSLAGFYLLQYFFVMTNKRFSQFSFLKILFLFISTILILMSFSKIAIGTFLILNIFYLVRTHFYTKCKICFSGRIITLIVLTILFTSSKGDSLSIQKRITLVKDSLSIISQHLLSGAGLGNYLIAEHNFVNKYPYFFLQPVHNIFLLLLSETGIILGGFIFYQLFLFIKSNIKNGEYFYILLAIVITGMFDHYWLTLQQNFLLLPVVFGLLQQTKSKVNSLK